jgi:hypothetical protein
MPIFSSTRTDAGVPASAPRAPEGVAELHLGAATLEEVEAGVSDQHPAPAFDDGPEAEAVRLLVAM